jgi:hypothetical protein
LDVEVRERLEICIALSKEGNPRPTLEAFEEAFSALRASAA